MNEFSNKSESKPGTEDLPVSQRVVETVAQAEGVDPIDLDPLYTVIDPDALNSIFQHRVNSETEVTAVEIRFKYHGYEVRVGGADKVALFGSPDQS